MLPSPTRLMAQAINLYRQKFFLFQKIYLLTVLPSLAISFLMFIYSRDLNLQSSFWLVIRLVILVFIGLIIELSSHLATYQAQSLPKTSSPILVYFQIFKKLPGYLFSILLFLPFCFLLFPIFYLPLLPYLFFQQKNNNPISFLKIHHQIWPIFSTYLKYFFAFFTIIALLFWLSSLLEFKASLLALSILFQLILTTSLTTIGLLYFRLVYKEVLIS